MFQDSQQTYSRRTRGSRRNRLFHLLQQNAYFAIVSSIENRLQRRLSPREKSAALRRISDLYASRPYPEETYEDWHEEVSLAAGVSSHGSESRKKRRPGKPSDHGSYSGDYDEYVRAELLQEFSAENEATEQEDAEQHNGSSVQRTPAVSANNQVSSEGSADIDDDTVEESGDDTGDESSYFSGGEAGGEADGYARAKATVVEAEQESAKEEALAYEEEEQDLKPDVAYARKSLRQWQLGQNVSPSWSRDHFRVWKAGLEVSGDLAENPDQSVRQSHVRTLTTIMHIKILQKQWDVAYNAFSLLCKLPQVDMRTIWPLGVEILTQLREHRRAGSGAPNNTKVSERASETRLSSFYDWLTLFLPLYRREVVPSAAFQGPVFRMGSRRHTPMYAISALWDRLSQRQYSKLRDTLDDLLLVPPYSQDGVFHYMMALCCVCENADLVAVFLDFNNYDFLADNTAQLGDLAHDMSVLASKDAIRTRVLSNNVQARDMLDACDKIDYVFPRDHIEAQLACFSRCLEEEMDPGVSHALHESSETEPIKDAQCTEIASSSKPNELSKSCPRGQPITRYAFKHGTVIPTTSSLLSVPEQHWARLIQGTGSEDKLTSKNMTNFKDKSWVWRFVVRLPERGLTCLLCGEHFSTRRGIAPTLTKHLKRHKLNKHNFRSKQRIPNVSEMEIMRQGQNIERTETVKRQYSRRATVENKNGEEHSIEMGNGEEHSTTGEKLLTARYEADTEHDAEVASVSWLSEESSESPDTQSGVLVNHEACSTSSVDSESDTTVNTFAVTKKMSLRTSFSPASEHVFGSPLSNGTMVTALNGEHLSGHNGSRLSQAHSSSIEGNDHNSSMQDNDSLEYYKVKGTKGGVSGGFEGFSPDSTLMNQSFARNASRDFQEFAVQTQNSGFSSDDTSDLDVFSSHTLASVNGGGRLPHFVSNTVSPMKTIAQNYGGSAKKHPNIAFESKVVDEPALTLDSYSASGESDYQDALAE